MTLEEARVRLEGALERLEAIEGPLREAQALLAARDWRTQWSHAPAVHAALAAGTPALDADLARANQLRRREKCPELEAIVGRVEQARSALLRAARRRTGAELAFPALLEDVERRARELPVPIASHEAVVLSGRAGGFGPWAARYTLTPRRLFLAGAGIDPTEVQLSDVVPGSVRVHPLTRTVELTAQRPFRLRMVEHAEALGRAIELERWLSSVGAAPPGVPLRSGGVTLFYAGLYSLRSMALPTLTLVLTSAGYALLPVRPFDDLSSALAGVLGAVPRVPISLSQFFHELWRCELDRAVATLAQVATALGTKIHSHRRVFHLKGHFNAIGFESSLGVLWFESLHYQEVQQLGALLAGWEQRYLDRPQDGGFQFTV